MIFRLKKITKTIKTRKDAKQAPANPEIEIKNDINKIVDLLKITKKNYNTLTFTQTNIEKLKEIIEQFSKKISKTTNKQRVKYYSVEIFLEDMLASIKNPLSKEQIPVKATYNYNVNKNSSDNTVQLTNIKSATKSLLVGICEQISDRNPEDELKNEDGQSAKPKI